MARAASSGLQAIAQVKLHESNDALDAAGLIEAADDVDIIVADRLTAGPGEIFPALPNLRAFVRCAVDIRNIDVDAASAAGVLVTRAGPGFVQSVAELALGFMVDLSRGVSRATADYHSERKPEIIMGRQLAGSRLGIIGYGSIGRYLAQIARVLGMEVLIADPFATVSEQGLQHVPLDDLLARSDFVVCLAVANEQTENLIGQAALARMQPHAFFINLSRGNLVDEAALSAALRENRIAGAAMDVGRALDQMPSPELAKLPNVIATPHIGGLTPPAIESQSLETVRQVEKIIAGEVPVGAVNAERLDAAVIVARDARRARYGGSRLPPPRLRFSFVVPGRSVRWRDRGIRNVPRQLRSSGAGAYQAKHGAAPGASGAYALKSVRTRRRAAHSRDRRDVRAGRGALGRRTNKVDLRLIRDNVAAGNVHTSSLAVAIPLRVP